ncbi:ABC transporter permease [Cereibacter changlensis JA139]|uniref:ABC transporter permease n=2 Tax=Cereibacter changlensis TaxID=402884 RepID=A0A2T4JPK4_9RHOB|nr:ABC transporter permease subunit [Cereibacter changlensis]PTE19850.1 ABC transporter permease [Cereibacter changlensis JA139]PZX49987.1 putative spermidine/putrescine transport system permease protein [Cereibacter changlensis]
MRIIAVAYFLFLAAPMVLLVVGAFGESWSNTLFPTGFTLGWFVEVAADPSFRRAFITSLQVVALTCIANVLVGVPLAWAIHSAARRRVRMAARIAVLVPVAMPELVLAFGFILVFSSDTLPWLGSFWLLVAGHVVLTLPYTLTTLLADLEQSRLSVYDQVAATLGGGFPGRMVDIILPLLAPSLMSACLTVAALSIGEFQLSNLIAGFLSRTYPIVLLQAFYGATGFACAATVVLLVLAALSALGNAMTGRLAAKEA